MRMPGIDGLETVRRIRAVKLYFEPIVLMLSSDDLKPQLARLKELGLDAYLIKPITRKELFEAIRRVLQNADHSSAWPRPIPLANDNGGGRTKSTIRILVAE